MLHETKVSDAKKYEIQILGDKFRVRLKRNQHDYVGVRRTVREQAVQDAERLVVAADISIPALEAEVERLNQESGTKEEALENAVAEAMRHWLERGSTSETRDVSRKLQTRMRRVKRGDDQDVLFAAAKMMVDEYLKMKQFAKDNPAQWLSDLDGYMSDYVSSPRGTSGLQYPFWRTGLRNLGNSCFLNAVVQCMVNCQSLRKDLCETHLMGPLRKRMEELTQRLLSEKWDCIAPYDLLNQIYLTDWVKFPPGRSADCSDCLEYLCSDCLEYLLDKCISRRDLYVSSPEATGREGTVEAPEELTGFVSL